MVAELPFLFTSVVKYHHLVIPSIIFGSDGWIFWWSAAWLTYQFPLFCHLNVLSFWTTNMSVVTKLLLELTWKLVWSLYMIVKCICSFCTLISIQMKSSTFIFGKETCLSLFFLQPNWKECCFSSFFLPLL